MINSKNIRFVFSMICLFSIFLFMGTESTGCLDCSKDQNGSITINNVSGFQLKIGIVGKTKGSTSYTYVLGNGALQTSWVKPGIYYVTASAAPYYNSIFFSTNEFPISPADTKIFTIEE